MTTYKGNAGLYVPGAIAHLANVHPDPANVLRELTDNSYDAGATVITITLQESRIIVTDNGRGMCPVLLPNDKAWAKEYKAEIDAGRDPGLNLKDEITPASLATLEWMMEYAGLSAKDGSDTVGVKGIGGLAPHQIANKIVYTTRPSVALAESYYDSIPAAGIPTYRLIAPTTEQMKRGLLPYHMEDGVTLEDGFNRPLTQGTRVELSEVYKGLTQRALSPNTLVEFFRNRYAYYIREGKFELYIIDKVTSEGRKIKEGKIIKVEPNPHTGFPVYQELHVVRLGNGDRAPWGANIYYDPEGKRLTPDIRKKQQPVNPITALEELNYGVWASGKVSGDIDYPDASETDAPWTVDKRLPTTSDVLTQWITHLQRIEKIIEVKIAEIQARSQQFRGERLTKLTASALAQALANLDVPIQSRRTDGDPQNPVKRGTRGKGQEVPLLKTLDVLVLNEHDQGVEGVTLELRGPTRARGATGRHGRLSFGELKVVGSYVVRLVLPDDFTMKESGVQNVDITTDKPGARLEFHVITGQPKVIRRSIPQITLNMTAWPQVDQPYDDRRLANGLLLINTEADAMKQAIQSGDEEKQVSLQLLCGALAIANFRARQPGANQSGLCVDAYTIYTVAHPIIMEGLQKDRRKAKK